MPNVFVLNRGPHNYSDAEFYGELIFCTEGSLDRDDTAQMYRVLAPFLEQSEPDDLILLTSLASLCAVASAMFAAKHDRLNLLIYNGTSYIERTIHLDNTHTRQRVL